MTITQLLTGLLALSLAACSHSAVPQTVADNPQLPRLKLADTELHVVVQGPEEAEVIIVLHGGPGADHRYLQVLEPLAKNYRVVWYDQRGTGLSARAVTAKDQSLDTFVADLDSLVDRFGQGNKVHILGHSWGAMIATLYAGKHPEKVKGLILGEPGFLKPEEAEVLMQEGPSLGAILSLSGAWLSKWNIVGPDDWAREDWFFTQALKTAMPGSYFCAQGPAESIKIWRGSAEVFAQTVGRSMEDETYRKTLDFRSHAKRIQGKVLFLTGSCSTLIGLPHQQKLTQHFRESEIVQIESAGHYMFNDRPEESIKIVENYLSKLSTKEHAAK